MKHIFISYCRKDEEWKDLLVKHLKAACLEDKCTLWDDSMIEYGSDWESQIQNALKNARIAIFLITVDFLNSNFIKNVEVPTLLKRKAEEGIILLPVLVKPCAWKGVIWLSSLQAYPRDSKCLSGLSVMKRDKCLADFTLYIKEHLTKPIEGKKKSPKTIKKNNIPIIDTSITPVRIDHEGPVIFLGREKELALIEANIPNKGKKELFSGSIQTRTGRLFHIDGTGGIGKTTLAIEAARRFGGRFKDGVLPPFRVDKLSPEAFAMELAWRLNVQVSEPWDKERAKELISALLKDRELLLVLDNVVNWNDLSYMLPHETRSMILVTTRNRDIYPHLRTNCRSFDVLEISLERFTTREALLLFRCMLGNGYKESDEQFYKEIAYNLGYLPIALRQSISLMIYRPHYTASKLLGKLSQEDRLELLRKGNAVESSDGRTIETVFDLSSSLLTGELIEALKYLSVCSPGPVTCRFLEALTGDNEIGERVEELYTYSWVERWEKEGICSYELHQLVRELVKKRYNNPFTDEMINCVHEMFTDKSVHFSVKEENFHQLEEGFRLACETRNEGLKKWLIDLVHFCKYRGYGRFYIRLTRAVKRLFPKDKWIIRTVFAHRALILITWGKLEEAMNCLKKQERICLELGDYEGLSACYGKQARILKIWGKLGEAMALHKKEEELSIKMGNKFQLSRSYGNQALILSDWGKLEEAMAFHQKEERLKEELGDRAGLAKCYGNQALILKFWNKLDEAMTLHNKEEAICEELGDLTGLAKCYGNKAHIEFLWGNSNKALLLLKEQKKNCDELGDRVGLAKCFGNQASILYLNGNYEIAMKFYKKTEEICLELGDRAGLAICWWNQGELFGKQGNKAKQLELWKKSIETNNTIGIPTKEDEVELDELKRSVSDRD